MTVPRSFGWSYPLFGLPYNGLATNEVLTLPGGRKMDYPFSGHQAVLVEGRNKGRQPPRTAPQKEFCRQQGYTFRPYALLSGYYREIGGVQLGVQSWLYCDERRTWIIDFELSGEELQLTARLWLRNVFGHLAWDATPPTMPERRLLAETTWQPVSYTGNPQRPAEAAYPRYVFLTHSRHGSVSVANIAVERDPTFFGPGFGYWWGGAGYTVHDVFRINLRGNGSIVSGRVGVGITGSIEPLANAQTMYGAPLAGDGTEPFDRKYYGAVTADGAITWAAYTYRASVEGDETIDGDYPYGNYTVDGWSATSVTQEVSFAGRAAATQTQIGYSWHREYINGSEYYPARRDVLTTPDAVTQCAAEGYGGSANCAPRWSNGQWICGVISNPSLAMSEPGVFMLYASLGCSSTIDATRRQFVGVNGHALEGWPYADGAASPLVAYNPGTGEFAVAPTPSDLVQWV